MMNGSLPRCRVVFLASQKARAARVSELILEQDGASKTAQNDVVIEILPGVAVFGSYLDDKGERVRYLSSIDYYGPNATLEKPQSFLSFFDEDGAVESAESSSRTKGDLHFTGISAVAVGAGLEDEEDMSRIRAFFRSISTKDIPVEAIKPNPEYSSMKEELSAFRLLSAEQKAESTRLGKMGPGKMARFVSDYAVQFVGNCIVEARCRRNSPEPETQQVQAADEPTAVKFFDNNRPRYCCRKCRTILFGEDDLEDPPHTQARHRFSARKINHGAVRDESSSLCQSIFLRDGCSWMGSMSEFEGKFVCPKCNTKLGTWNWSGSQCSCGTWVVPAIQIPNSKVDVISCFDQGLPTGTVVSPFARTKKA